MIEMVESKSEYKSLKLKKKVLVVYSAPWCTFCKELIETLKELKGKYPEIVMVYCDVPKVGLKGFSSFPVCVSYKKGRKIDVLSGSDTSKLKELAKRLHRK